MENADRTKPEITQICESENSRKRIGEREREFTGLLKIFGRQRILKKNLKEKKRQDKNGSEF